MAQIYLVIENSTIDRFMTISCLMDSFPSSKISPFHTAGSAILALKNTYENPSLILLDSHIGEKDEWSFLSKYVLLNTYSPENCKVILLTSAQYPVDLARAKKYACVSDYIQKPVTDSRIMSQIKAHFSQN